MQVSTSESQNLDIKCSSTVLLCRFGLEKHRKVTAALWCVLFLARPILSLDASPGFSHTPMKNWFNSRKEYLKRLTIDFSWMQRLHFISFKPTVVFESLQSLSHIWSETNSSCESTSVLLHVFSQRVK